MIGLIDNTEVVGGCFCVKYVYADNIRFDSEAADEL